MFSILTGLTKAVVDTAVLPIKAVEDVVTMGGATDGDTPSVLKQLKKIVKDLDDATK